MSRISFHQMWFGTLGIATGLAVVLSGIIVATTTEAAEGGISITIVEPAPR